MIAEVATLRHLDAAQAATALAEALARQLATAVAARGEASLVLSGGRTPLPMLQVLRRQPLPWADITITLADERFVPVDHPDSNERLLREVLLQDAAVAARFVGLRGTAQDPAQAASEAWQRLAGVQRPFDAVVLGMGDDGHTASLFPGSPGIEAALDPVAEPACVALQAPVAPALRLSLNLAALRQARRHYLHFTGDAKWRTWTVSAAQPVSLVLRRLSPPPQLYWAP